MFSRMKMKQKFVAHDTVERIKCGKQSTFQVCHKSKKDQSSVRLKIGTFRIHPKSVQPG